MNNIRPAFLTTLCFLTFFWNGMKILNHISIHQDANRVSEAMEESMNKTMEMFSEKASEKDQAELQKTLDQMNTAFTPDRLQTASLISILSSGLLIMGAIWMMYMLKRGFFTYLAGNLLGVIAPIAIFGEQIGWGFGILTLIVSALFTGLYAIYYKKFV